jgi:hypothetical protein
MTLDTRMEPIELTDDELKAVAGGQFTLTFTTSTNSFNDSVIGNNTGNITNSTFNNSSV